MRLSSIKCFQWREMYFSFGMIVKFHLRHLYSWEKNRDCWSWDLELHAMKIMKTGWDSADKYIQDGRIFFFLARNFANLVFPFTFISMNFRLDVEKWLLDEGPDGLYVRRPSNLSVQKYFSWPFARYSIRIQYSYRQKSLNSMSL